MKRTACLVAAFALASSASASVDFFFTRSYDLWGLNDPSLAFLHSKGNGTDYLDGYKLSPAGAPPIPPGDVLLSCNPGAPPQWAYIWARFNDEPNMAKVTSVRVNINGAMSGLGQIAWYALDNTNDPEIEQQRWGGHPEAFYFNPANLVAVTEYGVVNQNGSQPWNLYIGDPHRMFLLGAVKCAVCPSVLSFDIENMEVCYRDPPHCATLTALNKVTCMVPEPTSVILLAVASLVPRRR